MALLLISLLTLAAGPALLQYAERRPDLLGGLDAFIFVSVSGLVLLHLLPGTVEHAGWWGILAGLVGFFGPGLVEKQLSHLANDAHWAALGLAIIGLVLHALTDGAALSADASNHAHEALASAVVIHRLPVGLAVWWLLSRSKGTGVALGALGLVAAGTVGGFALGGHALAPLGTSTFMVFQGLVAGTLLHVIFHRSHPLEGTGPKRRFAEFCGALLGLLPLLLVSSESAAFAGAGTAFLHLLEESALALLIAYLGAGLLYSFLPPASMAWMGRGNRMSQGLKGMTFGLPLPVCSCGVIPLYRSLVQRGVPPSAGMAFLVATPELGIDAVLLSIPLLGSSLTVARVVAAALVALIVGVVVGGMAAGEAGASPSTTPEDTRPEGLTNRLKASFTVGYGEVLDETGPWILFGLAIAALILPGLDPELLATVPDSLQLPLFALLGLPTYVCASGATPLVAVLIAKGVSPGAAFVFLLTGPATNVTTFGVLKQLHGQRVAVMFGAAVVGICLALGAAVNSLGDIWVTPDLGSGMHHMSTSSGAVASVLLGLLFLGSLWRQGVRGLVEQVFSQSVSGGTLVPGATAPNLASEDPAMAASGGSCCH